MKADHQATRHGLSRFPRIHRGAAQPRAGLATVCRGRGPRVGSACRRHGTRVGSACRRHQPFAMRRNRVAVLKTNALPHATTTRGLRPVASGLPPAACRLRLPPPACRLRPALWGLPPFDL